MNKPKRIADQRHESSDLAKGRKKAYSKPTLVKLGKLTEGDPRRLAFIEWLV